MAASDYAIDVSGVAKTYRGRVQALRGIDLSVRRGEIFGLLGPNGAGKSTLIKILMTVIRPTRCAGTVLGQAVAHKPTLARVGYLPENHRFPRYLTGRQAVEFFGALAKVDRPTRKRRTAELLETVGMVAAADRRIGTYSKGMAQRIGLAAAMINDPDLILLDEPTDGVDPVGRRDIRNVLPQIKARGKTVFINSHLLSELEMVCDRVAILVRGSVARQGTVEELALGQEYYEIEVEGERGDEAMRLRKALGLPAAPPPIAAAPAGAPIPVESHMLANGQGVKVGGLLLRVAGTRAADIQPLVDQLRAAGLTIRRLQPMRPTLEELFMAAVDQTRGGTQ